jgi:hypothetical protein
VCPPIDDIVPWTLQQFDEKGCPDFGSDATCAAGRIQITTKNKVSGEVIMKSHATVLGCAKPELLRQIRDAKIKNQCDKIVENGTIGELYHDIKIEHCSRIETVCSDQDFCISPKESVIKEFVNNTRSIAKFEHGLFIGILVFIVVIIAAIIGAQYCSAPLNRPTNLPISQRSQDDTDAVVMKPRSLRKGRASQLNGDSAFS